VREKLTRSVVVVTLTLSLGLHWTFLQSVAWVGMVLNYSQTAPLKQALVKTFDGKNPCHLCLFVAQAKESEKKETAQKPVTKLEFFLVSHAIKIYPPVVDPLRFAPLNSAPSRSEAPPFPPPRQLLG